MTLYNLCNQQMNVKETKIQTVLNTINSRETRCKFLQQTEKTVACAPYLASGSILIHKGMWKYCWPINTNNIAKYYNQPVCLLAHSTTGIKVFMLYLINSFVKKYIKILTKYCSGWFGHIHLPAGKEVSGGSRQSWWNSSGQ